MDKYFRVCYHRPAAWRNESLVERGIRTRVMARMVAVSRGSCPTARLLEPSKLKMLALVGMWATMWHPASGVELADGQSSERDWIVSVDFALAKSLPSCKAETCCSSAC